MFDETETVELRARCTLGLRELIRAAADESARSMSAEISYRLRKSIEIDGAKQAKSAT